MDTDQQGAVLPQATRPEIGKAGWAIFGFVAGFFVMFILCIWWLDYTTHYWQKQGFIEGRATVHQEAIDAGVLEYKCDPKTGEISWKWKTTD
jgi:hypothetical protein